MIGVIIPPGEIKKMVQKTAAHVAKNGSEFEKALIEIEQNKPEFSFLNKDNPYRAYYDHMVAEYSKKLMAGTQEAPKQQQVEQVKQQVQKIEKEIERSDEQAEFLQKVFQQIKEPDPDRYSVEVPEKLTRADMAMIQHTAQYVAINGKNFLIALSEREKNNPQFEFLRTSSENHQYFTKIVAAYTHIMQIGDQEKRKIQQYINERDQILNKCRQIYEYHKAKQEQSNGKKQQEEKKKQSNVDWNDFELVETIIFDDYKPKTGYSDQFKLNKPLFYNKNMEQKIISEPKRKQLLQQCHVCKRNILATQMTKHLKTCLSSSKGNSSNGQGNLGEAVDVSKNLQSLSSRRPDIFGGEGQGIRKQQRNEQQQKDKVVWDGQAVNMSRTTAAIAMVQNQQRKLKQQMNNSK